MKEIREIIAAWDLNNLHGKRSVLATVVHLEGSSYRRPGARMIVNEEGEITGAISGGCLEGDALKKAMLALHDGEARLITYDTSEEDGVTVGEQLGCSGIVTVLFEPLNKLEGHNPISLLKEIIHQNRPATLITVYEPGKIKGNHPGTCAVVFSHTINIIVDDKTIPSNVLSQARNNLTTESSSFDASNENEVKQNVLYEFIPRPVHLFIAGAGNDAAPVCALAESLGWKITIADGRVTHAQAGRFTPSCTIRVSQPEKALEGLSIDHRTAVILMTHNYQYDYGIFKALLPHQPGCVLMLGPKKRYQRVLDDLKKEGIIPDPNFLERVFGPAGLEIGAETPEEIALSMIAGIQAALTGTSGQQLRQKSTVIHDRKG